MKKKTSKKKKSHATKESAEEVKAPVEMPKMQFEGRVVGKVVNPPKSLSGGGIAIDIGIWRDPQRASDARVTFIQALIDESTIKPTPELVKGDAVSVMGSIYEATWISKRDKTVQKRHFLKASSIKKLDITFD